VFKTSELGFFFNIIIIIKLDLLDIFATFNNFVLSYSLRYLLEFEGALPAAVKSHKRKWVTQIISFFIVMILILSLKPCENKILYCFPVL